MTNNYQTPTDFNTKTIIGDVEIVYTDLKEIGQGGPQVGIISINNKVIYGCLFGGPFLYQNQFLYVPAYTKRFLGWGFKLTEININTLDIKAIGKTKNLIYLDKIEGNRICFFEDVSKKGHSCFELDINIDSE